MTTPAIFFGHGNPMNAIEHNSYVDEWARIGKSIPKPKAIVMVSAHWYLPGTMVTAMARPRTIHDFGGFPRALYEVSYPAPGDPELARRLQSIAGAALDDDWGLDHGTWSVLRHIRPEADVPVVQLSIDRRLAPADHLAIGRALAPLRDQGILIMASGNVTHNDTRILANSFCVCSYWNTSARTAPLVTNTAAGSCMITHGDASKQIMCIVTNN